MSYDAEIPNVLHKIVCKGTGIVDWLDKAGRFALILKGWSGNKKYLLIPSHKELGC